MEEKDEPELIMNKCKLEMKTRFLNYPKKSKLTSVEFFANERLELIAPQHGNASCSSFANLFQNLYLNAAIPFLEATRSSTTVGGSDQEILGLELAMALVNLPFPLTATISLPAQAAASKQVSAIPLLLEVLHEVPLAGLVFSLKKAKACQHEPA